MPKLRVGMSIGRGAAEELVLAMVRPQTPSSVGPVNGHGRAGAETVIVTVGNGSIL